MMGGCQGEGSGKKAKGEVVSQIETLNERGLRELLRQRNGKYLFLNVWATWCLPCVEEFPDIVRLAKQYENTKFEFVAISVDYPDEIQSKILPFVAAKGVPFKVYVADFSKQENLIDALNESWNGAIPATFIFDGNSVQRSFLLGKQSYEEFVREIENVLNTSPD